ncbi:hypothetical protein ElyMa_005204600 [Elysia marginata]|uniref:Uncharacterized protein n=1 Tax=Elysia marginata TaxID=1093978 RepID=A0AAV4JWQ0_9GAST|nr:hypothetical protein ElyMa_005204600 [Elysia marginata]
MTATTLREQILKRDFRIENLEKENEALRYKLSKKSKKLKQLKEKNLSLGSLHEEEEESIVRKEIKALKEERDEWKRKGTQFSEQASTVISLLGDALKRGGTKFIIENISKIPQLKGFFPPNEETQQQTITPNPQQAQDNAKTQKLQEIVTLLMDRNDEDLENIKINLQNGKKEGSINNGV